MFPAAVFSSSAKHSGAIPELEANMNWLKQLVSDGEQPSTMRVMLLIVMLVWAVLCIRQNTFVVPPMDAVKFLGTIFGAKVGQSFAENFRAPKAPAADLQPPTH